jgi:hypothetical protein
MQAIWGVLGVVLLVVTAGSILRTLVLPRGMSAFVVLTLWHFWRTVLALLAPRSRSYEVRDVLMAWLAPLILVSQLFGWLAALLTGYTLLNYAVTPGTWYEAFREAGSSLFTLGFAARSHWHLSIIDFAAAASGPLVTALQIAYLPTLYAAYNRRETEVTLLTARAGEPMWGPELLARQALVGTVEQLRQVYAGWERLAADIGESHANYPVLLTFRSPRPYRSWIVGLLAVLDAAALHIALVPAEAPPEARLVLRAGFTALRDIARVLKVPFDDDPRPDTPIALSYAEFVEGVDRVQRAGLRPERTAEEAWEHFRGWRVNYESLGCLLARKVDAVPALWTGPRDWTTEAMPPRRPPHRRPDNPDDPFPGDAAIRAVRE